jgi:hypothetical protein
MEALVVNSQQSFIMKHIGIYAGIFVALAMPVALFAQTNGSSGPLQTLIGIEDKSKIFELLSLWSVLIIAFATSAMVWIGGRKMHGGIFGTVLTLFSVGMTLLFLSAATEIPWIQGTSTMYMKMVHDLLYIVGFILMGLGASKLLKVIKGE